MNLITLPTLAEYNNFKTNIIPANSADVQNELLLAGGLKIGASSWYWLPTGVDLSYALNWGANEPNNPVNELCLSFYGLGGVLQWNDMPCMGLPVRFVCEKFL